MPNRDRKQAYTEYWTALKQSCLENGANKELQEMFFKFKPNDKTCIFSRIMYNNLRKLETVQKKT